MAKSDLILNSQSNPSVQKKIWRVEDFRYDDRCADKRERINKMDIVGRARALVWGPYKVVTPGRWLATARFTMDEWACRHHYLIEFGHLDNYTRQEFRPGKPGVYEYDIEFTAVKKEKAELRIILFQGSLGGEFEFLGADALKLADVVQA